MKVKVILLLLWFFPTTQAAGSDPLKGSAWDHAVLNTAADAHYLSSAEKELILEINKMRSDPARYARQYILPLAQNYNRKILHYPGDKPLRTREGVPALYECVRVMKKQPALPLLFPRRGLAKAARDHLNDQSRTGETGHRGSDKSGFRERIERYGSWEGRIAENIAYGGTSARQIIIYLLIDDGIPGRGHRKNFLNPAFKTVGVARGSHPSYPGMSVIDFAGSFKTEQP